MIKIGEKCEILAAVLDFLPIMGYLDVKELFFPFLCFLMEI
jgi:hypothetical protein